LTESFRNWIDDFRWTRDSKAIWFTGEVEATNPIFRYDLATGAIQKILTDKTIDAFAFSPAEDHIFYAKRSINEPSEIYATAVSGGSFATSEPHKRYDRKRGSTSGRQRRCGLQAPTGVKIQVFLVKPHNFDPSKKYPIILNVSWRAAVTMGRCLRGDWQVYPGAGYIVALSEPHGSTGFGQDFTAAISGDYGGKVYEDLMKITDALEKLPYVDRDRMGAMGWSFGGYMMDWFEGHNTRFKALASMMGIYDLRSFYGGTEEDWFPEWDLKGQPWDSPVIRKVVTIKFCQELQDAVSGDFRRARLQDLVHAIAAVL